MKSLPWRLLLLANLATAVAAAIYVCAVWINPERMSHPDSKLENVFTLNLNLSPAAGVVTLCCLALLAGDFLWLLYGRHPKAPANHVLSETPDGPVKISREALETSLRVAGEGLEEISRVRVSVDPGAGMKRILVGVQFQAPDGVSIQDASHRLRRQIGLRFHELVRMADGGRLDMDVEFLGFSGRLPKRPTAATSATPAVPKSSGGETEAGAEFTGPQYPIDDDPTQETS